MAKNFKNSIGGGKKDALISQLIRGTTQKEEEFTLAWLPHEKVYSVAQARKKFINIEGLAATMKGRRQNQAITVYPADADGRHQIKTGERRWRAAVLNNEPVLATILNHQKKVIDAKLKFDQIVENDQREPLTPLEMAKELGALRDEFNLKPGQIAEGIGRPAAYVSKHLKLLEMPEEVQNLMEDGIVTYIETLNILTSIFAASREAGLNLADEARSKGELSRADAQEFFKALKGKNSGIQPAENKGPQVADNPSTQQTENNKSLKPDNTETQLTENNNSQQPENSGTQLNENNGNKQPDNSDTQPTENIDIRQSVYSSTEQTENNFTQQLANTVTPQTGSRGAQKPDTYTATLQDSEGGQELTKTAKHKVTFYVKIDDDIFELIDKPSIVENGEVHVFCREREGMPEMQVPSSECTLHHASFTK